MSIITLSHGSGGKLTHDLINEVFYEHLNNDILIKSNDSSILPQFEGKIAISTDSFVINPIFFPGGDIGKLAVCGTVNDLAMSGAIPKYLTLGLIIEEGFLIEDLKKIISSIGKTAKEAGVKIVAGDTKVVERGAADKIFINTTGVGLLREGLYIGGENAKPGDKIIISGTIGDHGVCIMSKRKNMEFDVDIESDCGPLNGLTAKILSVSSNVKVFRDPTRGGVATTLNEIAKQSKVGMLLYEEELPIKPQVMSMCELLGMEPLYVANEGKLLAIVAPEDAQKILDTMKEDPMGVDARIIGEVTEDKSERVCLKTALGSTRILSMPLGELLPRIC